MLAFVLSRSAIPNMASSLNRSVVLVYGIVSYFIGVAGLACIILALAKTIPFGFLYSGETSIPVLWNLVLVALWGLSHSVMARRGFKTWITKFIPEPAERSTYVLVSGVVSVLLIGLWFEERDLVREIGQPYEQYRRETGKVLPRLFGRI